MLRDEVHQLAAEIVNLTAMLEGDNSPIDALVDADDEDDKTSLAARIRALRNAARAAE
jgi:hypothetical protein